MRMITQHRMNCQGVWNRASYSNYRWLPHPVQPWPISINIREHPIYNSAKKWVTAHSHDMIYLKFTTRNRGKFFKKPIWIRPFGKHILVIRLQNLVEGLQECTLHIQVHSPLIV